MALPPEEVAGLQQRDTLLRKQEDAWLAYAARGREQTAGERAEQSRRRVMFAYVPESGETIEERLADVQGRRAREARSTLPRSVAELRDGLKVFERAAKEKEALIREVDARVAATRAQLDGAEARARDAQAAIASYGAQLESEKSRAAAIAETMDLGAVEKNARTVAELESRIGAATRIADAAQVHVDTARAALEAVADEATAARAALLATNVDTAMTRLMLELSGVAATVRAKLAPVLEGLERSLVEACAAGVDPGDAVMWPARCASELCAALATTKAE